MSRYWIFCLAVLALVLLGACGGGEENSAQQPAQSSQAQKPEEQQADQQDPEADKAEAAPPETPEEEPADEPEPAKKDPPPPTASGARPAPPAKADKPKPAPAKPAGPHPALLDPSLANETAPDQFRVHFETTKGDFIVEVHRDWSPRGADRFYNLVRIGYFQEIAFFRVLRGFMAQFGIHGDPSVNRLWSNANIKDDPVKQSNQRSFVSFAKTGLPNSRSVQFFINYGDNEQKAALDRQGFSPFGQVVSGMEVVDSLYNGYGEGAPRGPGPHQGMLQQQGNAYLKANFPKLDYVKKATLVK